MDIIDKTFSLLATACSSSSAEMMHDRERDISILEGRIISTAPPSPALHRRKFPQHSKGEREIEAFDSQRIVSRFCDGHRVTLDGERPAVHVTAVSIVRSCRGKVPSPLR